MFNLVNELLIKYHFFMMLHARKPRSMTRHMMAMCARVKRRTPSQIVRMESIKGLR